MESNCIPGVTRSTGHPVLFTMVIALITTEHYMEGSAQRISEWNVCLTMQQKIKFASCEACNGNGALSVRHCEL